MTADLTSPRPFGRPRKRGVREAGNTGDGSPTTAALIGHLDDEMAHGTWLGVVFAVRTTHGGTMVYTSGDLAGLRARIDEAIRGVQP